MLTVLLGGARSGKSTCSERLAADAPSVTFIATGVAFDEEMTERIARHRADRPRRWDTIEEPHRLAEVVAGCPPGMVIVDCLTTWVGNLMARGDGIASIERAADEALDVACAHPGRVVAVTNEVGMGIVPETPMGREYRDLLGRINQRWVAAANDAWFIIAGRGLALHDLAALADDGHPSVAPADER